MKKPTDKEEAEWWVQKFPHIRLWKNYLNNRNYKTKAAAIEKAVEILAQRRRAAMKSERTAAKKGRK